MNNTKPLTPDEALIVAIATLKRATPPETWSEFLAAFKFYTDHQAQTCIASPPGEALHVAQGRAQNSVALQKLLTESTARADKILENRK